MIDRARVLSTVQQIKLRKLELEVEALWQRVKEQDKTDSESKLLVQTSK